MREAADRAKGDDRLSVSTSWARALATAWSSWTWTVFGPEERPLLGRSAGRTPDGGGQGPLPPPRLRPRRQAGRLPRAHRHLRLAPGSPGPVVPGGRLRRPCPPAPRPARPSSAGWVGEPRGRCPGRGRRPARLRRSPGLSEAGRVRRVVRQSRPGGRSAGHRHGLGPGRPRRRAAPDRTGTAEGFWSEAPTSPGLPISGPVPPLCRRGCGPVPLSPLDSVDVHYRSSRLHI